MFYPLLRKQQPVKWAAIRDIFFLFKGLLNTSVARVYCRLEITGYYYIKDVKSAFTPVKREQNNGEPGPIGGTRFMPSQPGASPPLVPSQHG